MRRAVVQKKPMMSEPDIKLGRNKRTELQTTRKKKMREEKMGKKMPETFGS